VTTITDFEALDPGGSLMAKDFPYASAAVPVNQMLSVTALDPGGSTGGKLCYASRIRVGTFKFNYRPLASLVTGDKPLSWMFTFG